MHTVGDIIKSVFPKGTPQILEHASDKDIPEFEAPGDEKVISRRRERFPDEHFNNEIFERDRVLGELKERWKDQYDINEKVLGNANLINWLAPPHDPIDLFAVCGRLLERSGAYHHVEAATYDKKGNILSGSPRVILVSKEERQSWKKIGATWRMPQPGVTAVPAFPPAVVEFLWMGLIANWRRPVFEPLDYDQAAPAWWQLCLTLLIIADEASEGVGQRGFRKGGAGKTWVMEAVDRRILEAMDQMQNGLSIPQQDGLRLYTLSSANPDEVCVLPKSRTTQVGCTIRNLSHNLALLPAQGIARAAWVYGQEANTPSAANPLRLLLIPYPYTIEATCFEAVATSKDECSKQFGWFSVAPKSVPPTVDGKPVSEEQATAAFLKFVGLLIERMTADIGGVDVIVFPELALTDRLHTALLDWVNKTQPDVEVIVAGLTSYRFETDGKDEQGLSTGKKEERTRSGNFAAITVFSELSDAERASRVQNGQTHLPPRNQVTSYHDKHHRWKLDRDQITRYGLGASLDPSIEWWERQEILSRRLTVLSLRDNVTATVLICEDLARTDPAQEVLRAIGPKLIFALLMDGPQIRTRWPARYATVLADDPGSSVLTFTSLGLIERSNSSGKFQKSHCVGLWRDAGGDTQELMVAPEYHGLALTLSQISVDEQTIDGREDQNAATWILSGVSPVKASGHSQADQDAINFTHRHWIP